MYTYIALIRGINVGGRNILPMQELKAIFTAMGFQEVKSYIQSGNIVFKNQTPCTDKTANKIISQIKQIKDFEPNLLLLESSDLKVALKNNPFPIDNRKVLHFSFLQSKPLKPNLDKLTEAKTETEQFKLDGKVFYLYAPDGIGHSKLAASVEKI